MNNALWMNEMDNEFDAKMECERLKKQNERLLTLLTRVNDEGWSAWSESAGEVEIHWSMPRELLYDIIKELKNE